MSFPRLAEGDMRPVGKANVGAKNLLQGVAFSGKINLLELIKSLCRVPARLGFPQGGFRVSRLPRILKIRKGEGES
jgi:hypothetical protein